MTEVKTEKLPKVRGIYKIGEPLKKYTWLNVGGPAEVMFFPADEEDLQKFMREKEKTLTITVIGGGANLLVRDGGIDGVVVKLSNKSFADVRIEGEKVYCGAGLLNVSLKKILPEKEIGGLEFICSIPGTIGGLLYTNAGCFGSEIADVLTEATVMDKTGRIFKVGKDDFHFSYRCSKFPSDWIILEVCLQGKKEKSANISAKISEQETYRKNHQPQNIRTAGSTFKNPKGKKAWELIKNVGGTELKIGGVGFSAIHCNFLQNDGTATASDIERLGEEIRRRVKLQTGENLEWEIKIIGKKGNEDDTVGK